MPERFFISEPGAEQAAKGGLLPDLDLQEREIQRLIPEYFKDEFRMLKNVRFTLCTNTDIVQSLPNFVQALDTFEGYINNINRMYRDTKARLIEFTCRLAAAVNTYGVMIENDELIVESSVDEIFLENLNDEIILSRSGRILEHARRYLQAPNPFGIYHEIFTECETAMDDFGYATSGPGSSLRGKNNWKKEHDRLFVNAHEFMKNNLDRLVDSLKSKYPGFYREYQKARILEKHEARGPSDTNKPEEDSYGMAY
ncbi:MAG: hypothetical protein HF314_02630 [Ignavibacteria bacterium]|jgi:hypothetical protein|nr:hypothetical protein [Ignavibacteria bacterium]MCU7501943.1 hypothetical protein [Ignavibacteria bacterium]MCU7516911.1 hypothetical protein [Ignavibacteria bacterium]